MKILILAYASEPGAGSEYGVGWMVPTTMASRYPQHEIYVLTRSRCREKIEKALGTSERDSVMADSTAWSNLHFVFYDIPKWMFYKNEMQSNWGEQINYLLWQVLSRGFVRRLHRRVGFDVIHHLTFNQYRTPSPGFWMDIPFVMGPVGGAECIAPAFWQDLEAHSMKKEKIRRKGKDLKLFGWLNRRSGNRKIILCSSEENMSRLKPYCGKSGVRKMPAIAYSITDFPRGEVVKKSDRFEMLYAGKAWDWKGILIFLRAAKMAFNDKGVSNYRIRLIGIRFEDEQKCVSRWIEELGLQDNVELIPFVARAEILVMEKSCDLSVYPAFRDSGSMSVLEACALGCPAICFNAGGQDIFPDDILLKIPVGATYEECLYAFTDKLKWAYNNREELKDVGLRSRKWVEENLTWDRKVDEFIKIYDS